MTVAIKTGTSTASSIDICDWMPSDTIGSESPSQKLKARFMNLGPTLRWCEMVLWQLDHPESEARTGIEVNRMDEKLDWLRAYRHEISQWRRIEGDQRAVSIFAADPQLPKARYTAMRRLRLFFG